MKYLTSLHALLQKKQISDNKFYEILAPKLCNVNIFSKGKKFGNSFER